MHTIRIVQVDDERRVLRTEERGDAVRTWNHTMSVTRVDARTCRYTDEVDVDAGLLTPAVYAAAEGLYALRHRRWPALVAKQP